MKSILNGTELMIKFGSFVQAAKESEQCRKYFLHDFNQFYPELYIYLQEKIKDVPMQPSGVKNDAENERRLRTQTAAPAAAEINQQQLSLAAQQQRQHQMYNQAISNGINPFMSTLGLNKHVQRETTEARYQLECQRQHADYYKSLQFGMQQMQAASKITPAATVFQPPAASVQPAAVAPPPVVPAQDDDVIEISEASGSVNEPVAPVPSQEKVSETAAPDTNLEAAQETQSRTTSTDYMNISLPNSPERSPDASDNETEEEKEERRRNKRMDQILKNLEEEDKHEQIRQKQKELDLIAEYKKLQDWCNKESDSTKGSVICNINYKLIRPWYFLIHYDALEETYAYMYKHWIFADLKLGYHYNCVKKLLKWKNWKRTFLLNAKKSLTCFFIVILRALSGETDFYSHIPTKYGQKKQTEIIVNTQKGSSFRDLPPAYRQLLLRVTDINGNLPLSCNSVEANGDDEAYYIKVHDFFENVDLAKFNFKIKSENYQYLWEMGRGAKIPYIRLAIKFYKVLKKMESPGCLSIALYLIRFLGVRSSERSIGNLLMLWEKDKILKLLEVGKKYYEFVDQILENSDDIEEFLRVGVVRNFFIYLPGPVA